MHLGPVDVVANAPASDGMLRAPTPDWKPVYEQLCRGEGQNNYTVSMSGVILFLLLNPFFLRNFLFFLGGTFFGRESFSGRNLVFFMIFVFYFFRGGAPKLNYFFLGGGGICCFWKNSFWVNAHQVESTVQWSDYLHGKQGVLNSSPSAGS